jgi:acyl carrier protein
MDHELEARALEIIRSTLSERAERYAGDSDLRSVRIDVLGLDSLEKLQLVLDLENELSAMANESEVAACATVGELVALMMRSRAAR